MQSQHLGRVVGRQFGHVFEAAGDGAHLAGRRQPILRDPTKKTNEHRNLDVETAERKKRSTPISNSEPKEIFSSTIIWMIGIPSNTT